jgi:hypothetical protein
VDKDNNGLQPGGRSTQVRSPVINLAFGAESIADGDGNPDTDCTVDFGFWSGFSVGNLVWFDANNDGLRGAVASEPGIASLAVSLMNPGANAAIGGGDDTVVASTTTDTNGGYGFQVYAPGTYFIRVTPSATYQIVSSVTVSTDGGVDNDNNGSQPALAGTAVNSMLFSLAAGSEPGSAGTGNAENTIDFGLRSCPTITITPATLANAVQYQSYSQTMMASGGVGPYTWSLASGSGALPVGITLNSSTGVLAGLPGAGATPGSYNLILQAADSKGCVGTLPSTLTVQCPTILASPAALGPATQFAPYSVSFVGSGGTAPYSMSIIGTLPDGITFNTATRTLAGTPSGVSAPGSYPITLNVKDALLCSANHGYTLVVGCPTVAMAPTTVPEGVQGDPYSTTLTASGGTAPYTWSVSGILPAGLALNTVTGTTAAISGTPTGVESRTVTIRATDKWGCFYDRDYTINVGCPGVTISPPSPLSPVVQFSPMTPVTFTAVGGTTPYVWSIDGATPLPAGIVFNAATATISGTPTAAPATYSFTVRMVDGNNCPSSKAYSLEVQCAPININPPTLPPGTVGQNYSQTLTASMVGTSVPSQTYSWSLVTGTLPSGIMLSSSGVLSGIPSVATTSNITVRVSNTDGCFATKAYTLVTSCPTITITPAVLPDAYVNGAYSQTLVATGGSSPYNWQITSGTLPAGMGFSTSSGSFSGTPTSVSSTPLTVKVTDTYGCVSTVNYVLNVRSMGIGNLVWDDCNNNGVRDAGESGIAGVSVSLYRESGNNTRDALDTLVSTQATTGAGAYAFTNIPPGTYYVKVVPPTTHATTSGVPVLLDNRIDSDNNGEQPGGLNSAIYSPMIGLSPALEPTTDGDSDANTDWTVDFGLWTGIQVGNLVWSDDDNNNAKNGAEVGLPNVTVELMNPGSDNAIGGSGANADSVVQTTSTDLSGVYGFRVYSAARYYVRVTPPSGQQLPSSLAGGDNGVDGDNNGSQPGGVTTPIFSPVINLQACLEPGTAGTTNVENTIDFGIRGCPTITVAPASLAAATQYQSYNQTLTASGAPGPFTWTITNGVLPPGLTLAPATSTTATISGTPTAAANISTYNFTLQARDSQGCSQVQPMAITVNCPVITINQTTLPVATQYSSYSTTLTASTAGTTGVTYTWTLQSGTLPPGLTLSSGGVISGTPNSTAVPGTFAITVKASDPAGCFGTKALSLVLDCPPVTISGSLIDGIQDTPYSRTLTASGGTGPYTWTVSLGSLNPGLTLASATSTTATVSGTPTVVGSATFTIRATDKNGCQGEQSFTINVSCAGITISPPSPLNTVMQYAAITPVTFSAAGGRSPYVWSLDVGSSLPAGLSLSAGGTLTGTPTATPGIYSFTVKVVDDSGCVSIKGYSLEVTCPPLSLALKGPSLPIQWSSVARQTIVGSPNATYGLGQYRATGTADGQTFTADFYALYGVSNGLVPTVAGPSVTFTMGDQITGTALDSVMDFDISGPVSGYEYRGLSATLNATKSGATQRAVEVTTVGTVNTAINSTDFVNSSSTKFRRQPLAADGSNSATTAVAFAGPVSALSATVDSNGYTTVASTLSSFLMGSTAQPVPIVGSVYAAQIVAQGGTAPYTFAAVGLLPPGLSMNASGAITGTPTVAGTYAFTVNATDKNNCVGSQVITITTQCPVITISPPSPLPVAVQYAPYSAPALSAAGGTTPYTWSISSGSLPTGLALNSTTGVISGSTSAAPGTYTFVVRATDRWSCTGDANYSMDVGCPTINITPASLPGATQLLPYSQTISASGGTAPYTFTLVAGTLPSGLNLASATGIISGTPTLVESQTFTLRATDANSCTADMAYTLVVSCSFFPLQDGVAVVTMSGASRPGSAVDATTGLMKPSQLSFGSGSQFAMGIIDTRPRPATGPLNWTPSMYHGPAGNEWTTQQLGHVFGTTLDKDGNIYVAASAAYSGAIISSPAVVSTGLFPYGTLGGGSGSLAAAGTVYKIDKNTGLASVFASLPQQAYYPSFDPTAVGTLTIGGVDYYFAHPVTRTGPGLGAVAYDLLANQFFVANFEDGKIYRVSAAGAVLSSFDPLTSDNGTAGGAPLGERIWGLAVRDGRLYYSVWLESYNPSGGGLGEDNTGATNQVRSVALVSGVPSVATDRLELSVPAFSYSGVGRSNPIADIEFDASGNMLLCERSMINLTTPGAQAGRVMLYRPAPGGTWIGPRFYHVGSITNAQNSTGGGDFGYSIYDPVTCKVKGCDQMLWLMGDLLRNGSGDGGTMPAGYTDPRYSIAGLQGTPVSTSFPITAPNYFAGHNLVDLDQNFTGVDTMYQGDADVMRHSPTITANSIANCASPGMSINLTATVRDLTPWVVKPLTWQWYRIDDAVAGTYTPVGAPGTISTGTSPFSVSRIISVTAADVDHHFFLQVSYGDATTPCIARSNIIGAAESLPLPGQRGLPRQQSKQPALMQVM